MFKIWYGRVKAHSQQNFSVVRGSIFRDIFQTNSLTLFFWLKSKKHGNAWNYTLLKETWKYSNMYVQYILGVLATKLGLI